MWEAESDVAPAPLVAHRAAQARTLPRSRNLLHVLAIALVACTSSLFLYGLTLAPTVGAGSAARLQLLAHDMAIGGDAGNHPLTIAVGHLFARLPIPFGDEAYRVNLASAVTASLALTVVFLLALSILDLGRLGGTAWGRVLFAGIGTASLAVGHGFWGRAVVADATPMNVLLLALTAWLFGARMKGRGAWTVIAGTVVYALLITNQRSMAVLAPVVLAAAVGLLARPPARSTARAAFLVGCAFLAGLLPLLYLEVQDFGRIAATQTAIRDFALRAAGLPRTFRAPGPTLERFGLGLLGTFLLSSGLAIAGFFLLPLRDATRRPALFLFGLAIAAAAGSLFAGYALAAAVWVPFAVWVAAGAAIIGRRATPLAALVFIVAVVITPPILYAFWPLLAGHPDRSRWLEPAIHVAAPAGQTTFTGPATPLHPWRQGDRAARLQATAILDAVPAHTLLVTDGATAETLRYLVTLEGLGRPGIAVAAGDSSGDPGPLLAQSIGRRPVAVAGLSGSALDRMRREVWLASQGAIAFAEPRPDVLIAADRHFEAGSYGPAAQLYGEALLAGTEHGGTVRGDDPESLARWAVALTHCRLPELSGTVTQRYLAAGRDSSALHMRLGELYVATGASTWAENHFAEALAATPGPAATAYLNGRIAELRGDGNGALRAYRRALGFEPGHAGARTGIARLRRGVAETGGPSGSGIRRPHDAGEEKRGKTSTRAEHGARTGAATPFVFASAAGDTVPADRTFLGYDVPPRAVKIFAPEYPSEAKRARIEGTVDVRMTIAESGRVIHAVVHRSDTIPLLEAAALRAAKISLFRPALTAGRPVVAELVFQFPFKTK
jgi:TonB family protein